jgi:hypothetical protein
VYLSISTCLGQLCAQHQEIQLYLCNMDVILYGWLSSIPDKSIQNKKTKCRINTVVSPDDGHTFPRNMYRLINTLRNKRAKKNCAPSWLCIQDYTGMHGQQNIKVESKHPRWTWWMWCMFLCHVHHKQIYSCFTYFVTEFVYRMKHAQWPTDGSHNLW